MTISTVRSLIVHMIDMIGLYNLRELPVRAFVSHAGEGVFESFYEAI